MAEDGQFDNKGFQGDEKKIFTMGNNNQTARAQREELDGEDATSREAREVMIAEPNGHVTDEADDTKNGCCKRLHSFSCRLFCRKYFWEGQNIQATHQERKIQLAPDAPFYEKIFVQYRPMIAPALAAVFWWVFLFSLYAKQDLWQAWREKYFITITMVFGSLIAGATCEGGAAVAFPVMTLAFKIPPIVARDFAVVVQSGGLTTASICILFMKVKIEVKAVVFVSLGAFLGMIIGLEAIDPYLTPPQKKIGFVSTFFAFAFALFLLNLDHKRRVFVKIPEFKPWKAIVLVATGIVGGIFTSIGGSGTDICSFSMLTLLFRVSEKTATPTSVIIMAINSAVGFLWRGAVHQQISTDSYQFAAIALPVICIGAPIGTVLGTHVHRLVLASFVYVLTTVSFVSALAIVPMNVVLWVEAAAILVVGFAFFFAVSRLGRRLLDDYNAREERELEKQFGLPESSENDRDVENKRPVTP